MKLAILFVLGLAPLGQAGSPEYFTPSHRVSGIGVARDDVSSDLLSVRTDRMIQSQTFGIMRDANAVPGAKRITSPRLQTLFHTASEQSGFPQSVIEAIAYLESWGDANAQSPSGPRGIMQISSATARSMGLKVYVTYGTKVTRERVAIPSKNKNAKSKYKTVTRKTTYVVSTRDERLLPERAVPAAARYLAGLRQKFGGLDWAIFAYHCGEGCVAEMLDLTRHARGVPADDVTVPRMFFAANPARNRELYQAIEQQMLRDYSPTYYFRVMRAEQLLGLYRRDPEQFEGLSQEYRSDFTPTIRASHRLAVWLRRDDLVFHSCEDIRADGGKRLVKALDRPEYFGYQLQLATDSPSNLEYYSEASPAAIGTLAYIAFETRRLHEELKPKGERFHPLPVTALVEPEDFARQMGQREGLAHCSGQVFDIDYASLPPGELECLRFVLSDLGWDGYIGFVEEGRDNLHIGCSPASRDFFATVFEEAVGLKDTEGN
ncbi:MAG TPA: transglycosylase SLT domain-containing protein [Bryobacteraceae bacterium]|nr:transglycosylase SLT domain-containing protein [Bryobacteraceae bacterium]